MLILVEMQVNENFPFFFKKEMNQKKTINFVAGGKFT